MFGCVGQQVEVHRKEPHSYSGLLEKLAAPVLYPGIIEYIGRKYGGGKFKLWLLDSQGKKIKSRVFDIAGQSRLSKLCNCPIGTLCQIGCICGGC